MANDKIYIIDPMTSICKVALLYFMPEKTRLAINHHILYIQNYNCYQWIERMKNGDSRIDISNLNMPLLKAIKWYILDGPDRVTMDKETSDNIKSIVNFTIKGLSKLRDYTYHSDLAIKIILQYFINLLRDALNNNWNEDNIIKMDNNGYLTDKIKNNFDPHIINSIAKILLDAAKIESSQEDINALVECAHKLLINRDIMFVKMMKDINTTL
jgi:hypothetical protein